MAGRIDSSGEIETILHDTIPQGAIEVGDKVLLIFRSRDEPDYPINVQIHSPSGAKILERVLRELPTGMPQSAPPIDFVPMAKGTYTITVREVRGTQRGHATLQVG
jgi:hypothetical protein